MARPGAPFGRFLASWRGSPPHRVLRWLEDLPPLRAIDYLKPRLALALGVIVGGLILLFAVYRPGLLSNWLTGIVVLLGALLVLTSRPVALWAPAPLGGKSLLDMVPIQGGWFVMGSPIWERGRFRNETQHRVKVSDFWMSKTLVTHSQFHEVMGKDPDDSGGGDLRPVTEISWFEAVAFCNRLSEQEGLQPCYSIEGDTVEWVADDGGYRLPTEAEWEYAARAGSRGRWPFPASKLADHAWFQENSDEPKEVATRESNPWGLYDLHGNALEWCWDRFGAYGWGWAQDPRAPGDSRFPRWGVEPRSEDRVLRGGSFGGVPRYLRSAVRDNSGPEVRFKDFGFRCVRRPDHQPDQSSS